MTTLAIDLGGTRLKAGAGAGSDIRRMVVVDVPRDAGRDAILDAVRSAAHSVLDGEKPQSAGLCVPGLVDEGRLVSLPGKLAGIEETNFSSWLSDEFATDRVVVTNDAIAYATGEAVAGAGRGCKRAVIVTIGTGVGVTVVENGAPATGGMFGGGILGGFIPIADEGTGPPDTTGQTDTIEALCAADRLVMYCNGAYASVPDVYAGFARGEAQARAGVERYRSGLVRALVALAHAHAPERLILGGGPMPADNPVTPGIEELINARMFGTYRVQIRLAALGDEASLVGLLHLAERA